MNKQIEDELLETKEILKRVDYDEAFEYAKWTKEKANIKYKDNLPTFFITNNYIYWCNLGINIGSEQNKIRPVLIAKTKINSLICTVLPLTSKRMNDTRWYHIDLEKNDSTVLIEQLKNVSKLRIINPLRLKGKLVKITINDWKKINYALKKYYTLANLE